MYFNVRILLIYVVVLGFEAEEGTFTFENKLSARKTNSFNRNITTVSPEGPVYRQDTGK
jgi:hypothetical protein